MGNSLVEAHVNQHGQRVIWLSGRCMTLLIEPTPFNVISLVGDAVGVLPADGAPLWQHH